MQDAYLPPAQEIVAAPTHRIAFPMGSVKAMLTDIEGTTTSISFVHDVLFPYAKKNVGEYLYAHQMDEAVLQIVQEVKEMAKVESLDQVIGTLLSWMEQDKKLTPLKTLQGLMWDEGYRRGDFQGHLYEDAYLQMKGWKERGMPLYVYSSGSVHAQKLLFSHSNYGDITPFFSGYFDTKVGIKKESASYTAIAEKMGLAPEEVLFLTDSMDEVKAAKAVGMQTVLVCREGTSATGCPSVSSFYQIDIQ
ncbi:MAG TPA: acireductone synthase [Chlamydiales bacterium]|nr:acireductone synthase [Chlamydiales bacterium]